MTPEDASSTEDIRLPVARTLAHVSGGRIVLVRVTDDGDMLEARGYLTKLADELRADHILAQPVVERGDVAAEVEQVADVEYADAIVMVTRRQKGFVRALLGSVTERR